jgi:putative sigma-54 modulation protein
MHIEVQGIHYDVKEEIKEYIEKKLHKVDFAKDMIVDLLISIIKEKKGYRIEININFRWGVSAHIHVDAFDLYECIDKMIDKVSYKVAKEKEKIKQH